MAVTTHTQHGWFAGHVQMLMSKLVGEPVELDEDGDIPMKGETAHAWVRADAREPWGVQIFALAAHGVPVRAATLREINDINMTESAIKVAISPEGYVHVAYRLFADAVTEDNLRGALHRVITVADELGPMLTTVYGGRTPIPLEPSATDA